MILFQNLIKIDTCNTCVHVHVYKHNQYNLQPYFSKKQIVAAFPGMHVSPGKHGYRSVTDRQTADKVIPMCRYASQATQKLLKHTPLMHLHALNKATKTKDRNNMCKALPSVQ